MKKIRQAKQVETSKDLFQLRLTSLFPNNLIAGIGAFRGKEHVENAKKRVEMQVETSRNRGLGLFREYFACRNSE